MLLDFYSVGDLVDAKKQVLHDISDFKSEINLPHIPDRREGEGRVAKVVDDIITILTRLDESLKLSSLPKYVADGPDAMPSSRLYEGDLMTLLKLFGKLQDTLEETRSSLSAIAAEVQGVKQQVKVLSTSAARPRAGVSDAVLPSQPVNDVRPSGETESKSRNSQRQYDESVGLQAQSADGSQTVSTRSWADAAVAASTPTLYNRFAPLQNVNDDDEEAPFVDYYSRRAAKRVRQQSELQQQQQQQQQQVQQSRGNSRRRGRVVMTGKSGGNGGGNGGGVTAAKKILKKSVFCVDNVQTSCSERELTRFVSSLNVSVISCFKVNPRRRRNETEPITDRNAYRLCIDDSDRDRLLDESKWPEHVVISEWYYLNPDVVRQRRAGRAAGVSRDNPAIDTRDEAHDDTVLCHGGDAVDRMASTPSETNSGADQLVMSSDETILAAFDNNIISNDV